MPLPNVTHHYVANIGARQKQDQWCCIFVSFKTFGMDFKLEEIIKQVQEITQSESMQPSPAQKCHPVLPRVVPQGTWMLTQSRQGLVLHLTSPERSSLAPLPSLTRWPQIQCTVEISHFTMLPNNNLPVKVYSTNLLRLDFFPTQDNFFKFYSNDCMINSLSLGSSFITFTVT